MNKRHYEHTLPNIRGSLSNTYPKPGYSQLKIKEYATSDHHKTVTSSDRDARDKKTESTRPATGNQAATKGNNRSRSHLKAAEPRSGNLQTSGQEQAAGRILQRILKHIV